MLKKIKFLSNAAIGVFIFASFQNFTTLELGLDYKGIYTFINAPRVKTSNPRWEEYEKALLNPSIDGITIVDQWKLLEITPGQFDWKPIDDWITLAVKNNKKISFGVSGGAASPDWLMQPPYDVPNVHLKWDRNPNSPAEKSLCMQALVPLPWDLQYRARYINMMKEVHNHFKNFSLPGYPQNSAYRLLKIVEIGGINLTTYELRIGSTSQSDLDRCNADPSQTWLDAGYSPGKILTAWEDIAQNLDDIFEEKNKIFSIDIIAKHQAFPNVNNLLNPLPTPYATSIDPLTRKIINSGISRFGNRFSIQWDAFGLGTTDIVNEIIEIGQKSKIKIAWQTNNLGGGGDYTGCGNRNRCNPADFEKILHHAIDKDAKYIEIHSGNAADPMYEFGLSKAQRQILKKSD